MRGPGQRGATGALQGGTCEPTVIDLGISQEHPCQSILGAPRGACEAQTTLAPEWNRSRCVLATPKPFWRPNGVALEGCLRRRNQCGARAESVSGGACGVQTILAPERNRSRKVLAAPKPFWRPNGIAFDEGLRRPKHCGARTESLSRGACGAQTILAPERNRFR